MLRWRGFRTCAGYWRDGYDWRAQESRLNRFDQFITAIDGLDIHFVHQRSPHAEARPLVITHGWPGSIVEFHKVIEPLTNPTAYGGDGQPTPSTSSARRCRASGSRASRPTTGWSVERIADAWAALMARLGYDQLLRSRWRLGLGRDPGDRRPGRRTLRGDPHHAGDGHPPAPRRRCRRPRNSGRSTAPSTTGSGTRATRNSSRRDRRRSATRLADSPAGQAAWILEKFWAWTDCDGHPENVLTRDELLDNVMMYWATNSATSSARIYWESFGKRRPMQVRVPVGVTVYPKEIVTPVRKWMEADYPNIVPLVGAAEGRPLRRVRATGAVRRRHPRRASVSSADRPHSRAATPPTRRRAHRRSTEPARISPRSRRAAYRCRNSLVGVGDAVQPPEHQDLAVEEVGLERRSPPSRGSAMSSRRGTCRLPGCRTASMSARCL